MQQGRTGRREAEGQKTILFEKKNCLLLGANGLVLDQLEQKTNKH